MSFLTQKRPWVIILTFGLLQCLLTGFGTFFDIETGVGLYFVFINSYFNTIVVVLPILLIKRFGTGMLIYLPWAVSGLFVEYYMEYVLNPVLKSPLCVLGWCLLGLLVGLSADLSYRFIKLKNYKYLVVFTGIIMGLVNILLFSLVAPHFYIQPAVPIPFQKHCWELHIMEYHGLF